MKLKVDITLDLEVPDTTALASDIRFLLVLLTSKIEDAVDTIDPDKFVEWCETDNQLNGEVDMVLEGSSGTFEISTKERVLL